MKNVLIVFMLLVMTFISGCLDPNEAHINKYSELKLKYTHEESMAKIKADGAKMSQKEKEQLADMVADRVIERMKNEIK